MHEIKRIDGKWSIVELMSNTTLLSFESLDAAVEAWAGMEISFQEDLEKTVELDLENL